MTHADIYKRLVWEAVMKTQVQLSEAEALNTSKDLTKPGQVLFLSFFLAFLFFFFLNQNDFHYRHPSIVQLSFRTKRHMKVIYSLTHVASILSIQ